MPNSKQAKKRMVQNERQRQANKVVRTRMRTEVKRVLNAESAEAAKAAMPPAMKAVDKAAKNNVIHANAAARKKSQIAKAIRNK